MRLRYDIDRLDQRDEALVGALCSALEPLLDRWFSPVVRGLGRVPEEPALFVANHNGGLVSADTFVLGASLLHAHGPSRLPHALAHEVVLRAPGLHQLLVPLGAVRASPTNATRLFESGRNVLVYPGGDLDSMRPFARRDRIEFGERRGYVRLALRTGVPIVPVVAAGAHATSIVLTDGRPLARALGLPRRLRLEVCPITLSVPWGLVVGITPPYLPLPTRIFLEVMEPIRFERRGEAAADDAGYVEACHRRVHGAMEARLRVLAAERRRSRFRPPPPSEWRTPLRAVRTPAPSRLAPAAPVDLALPGP